MSKVITLLTSGALLGLSDGVLNPCTWAVIFILLSYLISRGVSRKRTICCGISFIAGLFLIYFLFLLGLVYAFFKIPQTYSDLITYSLGGILIGLSILQFRDAYLWKKGKKGVVLKITEKDFKRIHKIASAGTILASFALGFFTGGAEIPCAGIYPVAYAKIVTLAFLSPLKIIFYIGWYMLFFILPCLILVLAFAYGIAETKKWKEWWEKHRGDMKIITGVIMLILGITLVTGIFSSLVA